MGGVPNVRLQPDRDPRPIPSWREYVVYICECCDKRYATKNQFLNHSNSNRHWDLVRIYQELGVIVTHIELRGENGNDQEAYDDDEEDVPS